MCQTDWMAEHFIAIKQVTFFVAPLCSPSQPLLLYSIVFLRLIGFFVAHRVVYITSDSEAPEYSPPQIMNVGYMQLP